MGGNNTSRGTIENQDDSIGTLDNFAIEDVPTKIVLIDTNNAEGTCKLIAYHSEAQFAVRRLIIDVAKKHFRELEKLNMNAVLGHTAQKSK